MLLSTLVGASRRHRFQRRSDKRRGVKPAQPDIKDTSDRHSRRIFKDACREAVSAAALSAVSSRLPRSGDSALPRGGPASRRRRLDAVSLSLPGVKKTASRCSLQIGTARPLPRPTSARPRSEWAWPLRALGPGAEELLGLADQRGPGAKEQARSSCECFPLSELSVASSALKGRGPGAGP